MKKMNPARLGHLCERNLALKQVLHVRDPSLVFSDVAVLLTHCSVLNLEV